MKQKISRRLLPLYLAAFFHGFVLFYTVDKVFAKHTGLNEANIGAVIALMAFVTILFEIPSGILADRWSRKGVLLIGTLALMIASGFGAAPTTRFSYVGVCVFWAIFFAMYSGTYDAIVYDTLLEEQGSGKDYERWFGRVGRFDSLALMISSILGGVLAGLYGVRAPFIVTIPMTALAGVFIVRFKEPTIHRETAESKLLHHTKETFRAIIATPLLKYYFVINFLIGATMRINFEFDQFWLIQLGLPIGLFGVVNAALLSSLGLRSILANRINMNRRALLAASSVITALLATSLFIPNRWTAVAGVVSVAISGMLSMLVLNSLQQNELPSHVRAGALSALGTVVNLAFIPASLGFGLMAANNRVTHAAWLPFILLAIAGLVSIRALRVHSLATKLQ